MEGTREGFGATSQHGEAFFRTGPLPKPLGCIPEMWQGPGPARVKLIFL